MRRFFPAWLWPMLLFLAVSLAATYPTVTRLGDFTVVATDPLLEAWTLKWDVHSLLTGTDGLARLWNGNMFYPYPHALAFSEHLLATALILFPFTLLGTTPMVTVNLGVMLTTALSGWGMFLLVSWLTRNRWAGVVAGVFFAAAPFRMGHIIQLHLLSTHWIPFVCLAVARWLKIGRRRDLLLFVLFLNLQFFSCVNYAPLVAVILGVWTLLCLAVYRRLSWRMVVDLAVMGLITVALNWPVLRLYQDVSERMGVVRTLGDARVYGGSLSNYLTPMANSLLYGRWLGMKTLADSATPGLVVFLLAGLALVLVWRRSVVPSRRCWVAGLVVLAMVGLVMSFGANDAALGRSMAPVLGRWLPYVWLYDKVPLLQGLRVPLRFALVPTFCMAVLAGMGLALLVERAILPRRFQWVMGVVLPALILLEHTPAPLPGVSVAYGGPLQHWLAELPSGRVVLQLPYLLHTDRSYLELERVYQSAGHWQPMVNGGSGFKPKWLVEAGRVWETFPDASSFDLAQQLGVDYVILQEHLYTADEWANVTNMLPGYLPAVKEMVSVGDDLALRLAKPKCSASSKGVVLGSNGSGRLTFTNAGPATYVANPARSSVLQTADGTGQFLEPLFVPPGGRVALDLPLPADTDLWKARLANLNLTVQQGEVVSPTVAAQEIPATDWKALDVPFVDGAVLRAYSVGGDLRACGRLDVALHWESVEPGSRALVTVTDRFGRVVAQNEMEPPADGLTMHSFALVGALPPGSYSLRVALLSPGGDPLPAIGEGGVQAPELPGLPVIIRPAMAQVPAEAEAEVLGASLANGTGLSQAVLASRDARAGQWLRFTLFWQVTEAIPEDFTVFTQLLGPDGRVWAQQDNPPKGGWYPTSLWLPGELVQDDYALRIDPGAPAGEYRLIAGMYDAASDQRVNVTEGAGAGGDFVPVAGVMVKAAD